MTSMTTHDEVTVATLVNYPAEASVDIVEGTIYLSKPGGFEIPDLELMPDDGRRHELVDGVIVVSPSPRRVHQRAALEIAVLLRAAAPPDYEVLVAPFDVQAGPRSVVEPDVLVLPNRDMDAPAPLPLLVVEVLSRSNRGHDLIAKRSLYQRAGVRSYWIVDPEEPAVTVLRLEHGQYVEVDRVNGQQPLHTAVPYEIALVPADLVR
jgi:Uma2 family endonuclease